MIPFELVGVKNVEIYVTERNGHKFEIGEKLELFGMEDNPQLNGEIVTISNYREDERYGKCYYITGNDTVESKHNWIYEYRLRRIKE